MVACEAHTRARLEVEFTRALTIPGPWPLGQREWEALLPRFARYYEQLTRLPRRTRRTLQRQWRRSLAAIALLLALGQAPALAATINVVGTCTLVRAITAANTDTATGGCPAGSGADTLTLQNSSVHTLTRANNSYYGANGLPVVSSVITIEGNGSTITRDSGAPAFRIIAVGRLSGGDLTLNDTTVSGGVAVGGRGGGIANYGGRLTLENSTVSGNRGGDDGGGVLNDDGTVTVTNSTVSGNTSGPYGYGGGVENAFGGTLILTNSTVSGNSASYGGGGLFNGGGSPLTLTNSTVSGNSADIGGGVFNRGFAYGTVTVTLTNSTVSGNSATSSGGGVYNGYFGPGTLTLNRTLVSGNTAPVGAEVYHRFGGTLTADNFNLFGHSGLTKRQAFSGFTPGPSDLTATSNGTTPTALAKILNTSLGDNGGPTQTHALVAGSPAIDAAGPGCPPPATDQRGVTRPQGPACDIGSFEIMQAPAPDLAISKTDSPDPVVVSDHLRYTVTVNNAGQGEATGVILTDTLPSTVDFVSVRPRDVCAESGGVLTCELGTLASGERASVTIVVMPTATGRIRNRVKVTSAETDENPKNNTDSERTTVTKLLCNGRVPTLVGTPGNNTLTGTSGPDVIHGLGGHDTLRGRGGNDVLCGGEGNDTLFGGKGKDKLFGENGKDTLNGNNDADALDGGAGTDTCNGGSGTDTGVNCETVTGIP